jgi:hypothetical protein
MVLLGMEAVRFNRAFSEAGLASRVVRLGLGIDETALLSIGPDNTGDLHAVTGYVASQRSAENERFLELYHGGFGDDAPPVSVFGQSCYEGVHLVAALAHRAGSSAGPAMVRQLATVARRGRPRDLLPGRLMAACPKVHLSLADGLGFRVLASH